MRSASPGLIRSPKLGEEALGGVGAENGTGEFEELVGDIGVRERRVGIALARRLVVLECAAIRELDRNFRRATLGKVGGALLVEVQFDLVRERLHALICEALGLVGVEAYAAVHECARDKERRRELALEGRTSSVAR